MTHHVHLGVTGLRRSGKTVFLTALIYQLCELGSKNLSHFNGITLRAADFQSQRLRDIEHFPYRELLQGLRQCPPSWPPSTRRESNCVLRFHYANPLARGKLDTVRRWIGAGKSLGTIVVHLHDYPGEYLLDVGLITKSYERWSAEAMVRMGEQCPEEARRYAAAAENARDQPAEEIFTTLRGAYAAYVLAARSAGLELIQPGMSLSRWYDRRDQGDGDTAMPDREELPFLPLPDSMAHRSPLVDAMRASYQGYVQDGVRPFVKRLRQCRTQLVLVDVLRVLRNGVDCYNDTRRCIAEILQAYHAVWRPFGGIQRVLFAATKADHATKNYRPNMTRLLDDLVFRARGHISGGLAIPASEWFSSVRATKDVLRAVDSRPLDALFGLKKGESAPAIAPYPGLVPSEWPDSPEWTRGNDMYDFPDFEPQPLPKYDGAVLPHINLDRVIWSILADCF